jgi:hypothetical protein
MIYSHKRQDFDPFSIPPENPKILGPLGITPRKFAVLNVSAPNVYTASAKFVQSNFLPDNHVAQESHLC